MAGQRLLDLPLDEKQENILPLRLKPGIYLLVIIADPQPVVRKFLVAG